MLRKIKTSFRKKKRFVKFIVTSDIKKLFGYAKTYKIGQYTPSYVTGDATGNIVTGVDKIISSSNIQTNIFANSSDPQTKKNIQHICWSSFYRTNDLLILHYGGWCDSYNDLLRLPCKKILYFHNITPAHFFTNYSNSYSEVTENGIKNISKIRDCIDYAITDSEFNKSDLLSYGYDADKVFVLPLFVDFGKYCSTGMDSPLNTNVTNILFVGRVAPNKKIEDVIESFFYYRKNYNPDSKLTLVGKWQGLESYKSFLDNHVDSLQLSDSVEFTGSVSNEELYNIYKTADLFLCMSEHEGFCVPLVEAMHFEIPTVAYDSSAVTETLGDAGILVKNKDFPDIARIMDDLITNSSLKVLLKYKQRERVKNYDLECYRDNLIKILHTMELIPSNEQ